MVWVCKAVDAQPLMILAPMAPVLFLFEIADTDGADMDSSLLKSSAVSLNAVFHATQYIEDMGKAVWQYPKKKRWNGKIRGFKRPLHIPKVAELL